MKGLYDYLEQATVYNETKNQDVIDSFTSDSPNPKIKTQNLRIEKVGDNGDYNLINYYTVIAKKRGRRIFLDRKRYSVTTSKIQNYVRRGNVIELDHEDFIEE